MSHPLGTAHPFRTTSAPLDVYSQHRQPIALHVTSTTILAPPSCSSANSRFAVVCHLSRPPSPRSTSQYRTLSVSDRVAMSRCVPAGRSPVFSSLGSLVSCFGRVWSGLSRRVPRCARRGPVSFLVVVPCRRAHVVQRAPRLACLEYTFTSSDYGWRRDGAAAGWAGGLASAARGSQSSAIYRATTLLHITPCWMIYAVRNRFIR